MRAAALILATAAALSAPSISRGACDIVVGDMAGLVIAVANPDHEVICINADIEGTLDLGSGNVLEDRDFEIRSADPTTPITWRSDPAVADIRDNLLLCDPEAKVTLRLHDMVLDGDGYPSIAMLAHMCSIHMEGLTVRNFEPDDGLAALTLPGDLTRATEITRCWFEDIKGTVIRTHGGFLEITQSTFVGSHSPWGAGVVELFGDAEVASRGNLFWGNSSEIGGGVFAARENTYLFSVGDAYVANRAPNGGAIYWDAFHLSVAHGVFAGNATCDPGAGCQLDPVDLVSPLQPADPTCNFSAVDMDALDLPALDVGPGLGAAVALTDNVQKTALTKCAFLANDAGGGNGGALAWIRSDMSIPAKPGVPDLHLIHNTFAGNKSARGGAIWGDEASNGGFLSLSNLWLDHAGPPVVLEGVGWNPLLAANHVDGPQLLQTGGGPRVELEETRDAEPSMEACPTGCGDTALDALCGTDDAGIDLPYAYRPYAMHFGEALCPTPGDAWVDDTGLALDEFVMPDGSPPDRGFTGMPCSGVSFQDQDGDGVGDFADCDPGNEHVHPFTTETCNGIDDNCNGEVDEGVTETWYMDEDGDGFGGEAVEVCEPGDRMVDNADDCDDGDGEVHPGSEEIWGDEVDNDCDGTVDLDAPGCHSAGCLATRVAPGEEGLELSFLLGPTPFLALAGLWRINRRRH